jgi:hypothetical protein
MKFIALLFLTSIMSVGSVIGQQLNSPVKSNQTNKSYLTDSCKDFSSLKNIQSIKYYLVNSSKQTNRITLQNYQLLGLTKFYFENEKPDTVKEVKEEKSSAKWDWLYFAGTAIAAVIVYLVWPEKAPEAKQTLTFGKPLPPR